MATDIPGTDELVIDAVNGLLAKPADGQSLAKAILRLLAEPGLAGKLARQRRKRFNSSRFNTSPRNTDKFTGRWLVTRDDPNRAQATCRYRP